MSGGMILMEWRVLGFPGSFKPLIGVMVTYRTDKTYISWKLVWILGIQIEL
jgi:hypothetical protein